MIGAGIIPDSSAMREQRLAERIRSFWHLAGYIHVKVDASPVRVFISPSDPHLIWSVRSNLVNGLPPGSTPEQVAKLYHAGTERRRG